MPPRHSCPSVLVTMRAAAVVCLAAAAVATPPTKGSLDVASKEYSSGPKVKFFHPTAAGKYPLIVYAHGAGGGGVDINGYNTLFERIASFGFVVGAPTDSHVSGEDAEKVVALAGNATDFSADLAVGIGCAGHSMGGDMTGLCSAEPLASRLNVKAVLHEHCPCKTNPQAGGVHPAQVTVPFAIYTGTKDNTCTAETAQTYYDGVTVTPRTFRNQVGMNHLEPVLEGMGNNENPYFGYFTAAWFKVHIVGDKGDFFDHIYNDANPDSLCKYAEMARCENIQK